MTLFLQRRTFLGRQAEERPWELGVSFTENDGRLLRLYQIRKTKEEGPQCCGVGASLESIRSGLAAPRAWRRSSPPGGTCSSSTSSLYLFQRVHIHAICAAAATVPRACLADVTEVEPVFFLIVEPPLTHCVEKGGIFLCLYDRLPFVTSKAM